MKALVTLAAVLAVAMSLAAAQGKPGQAPSTKTMSATGVVTAVTTGSLVIEGNRKRSMTFTLDSATRVLKKGRARLITLRFERGEAGLKITDVLHAGDRVMVRFQIAGTTLKAIEIRVLSK